MLSLLEPLVSAKKTSEKACTTEDLSLILASSIR